MNAEVLCIQPPVYDFALYDLFFKPYGLMRIAGWLLDHGYRATIINALDYEDPGTVGTLGPVRRKNNGTGKFHRVVTELPEGIERINRRFARYGMLPEVLEAKIRDTRPEMVLITSQMTYWYYGVRETVRLVRKHHPGIPVIVGGVYASLMPGHCKDVTGADECVSGEVFEDLSEIMERYSLQHSDPPSDASAEARMSCGQTDIRLAREGMPERRRSGQPLLDPSVWKDAGVIRLNKGCPYNCTYCASRHLEPRFHAGDYREAFLQISEMYDRLNIRNFAFYDDALLVQKERILLPLLEEIIRHKLKLRIFTPNAVHMHYIDTETAVLMKKAGFQEVRLGYESADEDFHRELDTKYRPEEAPYAIEVLKKAGFTGLQLILYILAGLPEQSASEVYDSLRDVRRYGVRVSIAEYSPVPHTSLWQKAVEFSRYPIETEPLYHNNTFFPMEWEQFTRYDLQQVKEAARNLATE